MNVPVCESRGRLIPRSSPDGHERVFFQVLSMEFQEMVEFMAELRRRFEAGGQISPELRMGVASLRRLVDCDDPPPHEEASG